MPNVTGSPLMCGTTVTSGPGGGMFSYCLSRLIHNCVTLVCQTGVSPQKRGRGPVQGLVKMGRHLLAAGTYVTISMLVTSTTE